MSTSKHFNRICAVVMVLCLAVTLMLCFPNAVGIQVTSKTLGYESRLFDTSYVHSIDIVMDDWDSFVENCESEEYSSCAVVIDGESYKNIAIRAKGNTSLSQVANYGSDRYSFKLEFDHYSDSTTYHGLDKLCLNNIIQDNTYMKDYLCYTIMNYAGVSSPLCSFAYITVNGEDWGLYLAVEAVEDSFLERNYDSTGNLYKPDSMSMGGGRGNGKDFDQDDFDFSKSDKSNTENDTSNNTENSTENTRKQFDFSPPQKDDFNDGKGGFGGFGGMGSDDVKLIYTDDDFDRYENIFDSAKTDITDSDKTRLINSLKVLNSDDAASAVDVDAVIKYFAVHNFVCNFDSYTGSMIHNYYLYENDGILSMIPWDYNLAFGGFVGGSDSTSMINYPIDSPVSGGDTDSRPMLAWIFADEEYTELYHEALSEFVANYFENGYFGEEIDRVTALISPYVEKDPTKFCTYDEFTEGAAALKEFCTLRAESVRGQLDGTIPSTSDAQTEDSSALISGSSVSISAMGSMNGGGMGGGMQNGGFGTPPNGNFGEFNGTPPEMPNSVNSDGQMSSFDGEPPEPPNGEAPSGDAPQPPTNGEASGNTSSDEPQTDGSSADTEKAETTVPEQNEQTAAPSDGTNAPESPSSEASQTETSGKTSEDDSSDRQTDESNDTSETTESTEQNSDNAFPSPDQNGNNGQNRPQMPSDGGSPASASSSNTKTVVLLCVSAGALIAAILLTRIFKDRI